MDSFGNALLVLFALCLVALNGFFVAAEFAIVKLRHTRVDELQRQHGIRGRVLATVHSKLDSYLSACQLGITLASLGLGWVGEPAFARLLEPALASLGLRDDPDSVHAIAFVLAFAAISYLHIVLGELAPKSVALRRPDATSLWTALPLWLFYWAMYPFIWLLNASANLTLRLAGLDGGGGHGHEAPYSLDELRLVLQLSRPAAAQPDSELNQLLTHTLDLPNLHTSDVMRSRRELITIASDDSHADVRRTLQAYRYSRYPVLDADTGSVIGLVHLKDIFLEGPGEDFPARLRRHVRPLEWVYADEPLAPVLRRFRLGAPHLALVQDRGGELVGFLSMEDVLEAIFGEITDEHESGRARAPRRDPRWLEDGSLLVRGDTPLFQVERETGEAIPESETLSTVGGLLMEKLGSIPKPGDTADIGAYTARVLRAHGATVEAVQLVPRAPSPD
jgi:CBS domain containing-hemolysin-like protein